MPSTINLPKPKFEKTTNRSLRTEYWNKGQLMKEVCSPININARKVRVFLTDYNDDGGSMEVELI